VSYGTLRLGIFFNLNEHFKKKNGTGTSTILQKASASFIAGLIGAFCANPADIVLVRIQADNNVPKAERRNYKNIFHAFARIFSEEGIFAFWKGATPNIMRCTTENVAMLASYEFIKEKTESLIG
jgi:solute carrier family 25 (mitochondrial oxoglutarate transporter), member 11